MPQITVASPSRMPSFEIQFRLRATDKKEAETALGATHQNTATRLVLFRWLVGAAMLAIAGVLFWLISGWAAVIIGALLTALALFSLALEFKLSGHRAGQGSHQDDSMAQRWRVLPKGLERIKAGSTTAIPWRAIRRISRLGQTHGIFLADQEYFIIPDHGFIGSKQRTRFLRLVQSGITKARAQGGQPGTPAAVPGHRAASPRQT